MLLFGIAPSNVRFDHNANPLESIGVMEGDTLVVIHAMRLRKQSAATKLPSYAKAALTYFI
jgi:hypothetical protein